MIRQVTTGLLFSLLAGFIGLQSALADQANLAARGKQHVLVCQGCHTLAEGEPNGIRPNIWNVADRKEGTAAGLEYSEALKQFKGSWTPENLTH